MLRRGSSCIYVAPKRKQESVLHHSVPSDVIGIEDEDPTGNIVHFMNSIFEGCLFRLRKGNNTDNENAERRLERRETV